LELKSQGLDQRNGSGFAGRKEPRETVREYTTEQLPLQEKTSIVAVQNAIKQYWDISQKAQDNKEKIQAIEHYLGCHIKLWTLLYGGEGYMMKFGNDCHNNNMNMRMIHSLYNLSLYNLSL
jgi:hypothetical protein